MNKPNRDKIKTALIFAGGLKYLPRAFRITSGSHLPAGGFDVPSDFFGIITASSPDPACDDYIIARLKELGISHAKIDLMRGTPDFQERLLQRLLIEQFQVCLHLVQTRDEAEMKPADEQSWREFTANIFERYGKQVCMVEAGSTCNRRKWSGYNLASWLRSWRIAFEEASKRGITLIGPNVTDFEPIYNIALLNAMKQTKTLPAAHTDNLFVERATEPEAFDHKILGRIMSGLLRFNLIKKAVMLNDISEWAGIRQTICSQTSWSLRRIARIHEDIEEKQADYVARYCALAAASGAFKRVYWGPMIGQREGLIDDGTSEFPEIPHVTFYGKTNGALADYRKRAAFDAFGTISRFLAGARFEKKCSTGHGLEILEFITDEALIHMIWTMDGLRAVAADCYETNILKNANAHDRNGKQLEKVPALFSESPVYLKWRAGASVKTRPNSGPIVGLRFAEQHKMNVDMIEHPSWKGAIIKEHQGAKVDISELINMALRGRPETNGAVLRDARNRVWSAPAPWNKEHTLVIKRFKPRSAARKMLAPLKPDKAARSWNGAQELIRRGIATPSPIAFIHKPKPEPESECWFICDAYENSDSVRSVFTAFSEGAEQFENISSADFYQQLAQFIFKMHERGVFFRDLSAGNVLFRMKSENTIDFTLIDTARARFYPHALKIKERLADLMRICHPLHWPGREEFVTRYLTLADREFRAWMKTPFIYYDTKHRIKNAIKPLRGRKK